MKVRNFINVMLFGAMCMGFTACEMEKLEDNNNGTEQTGSNGKGNGRHNGHDYVDLGLPSGTLWATCNVGAENPQDFGDYFAWGEVEPKDYTKYSWDTYKWYNGTNKTLTKYCTESCCGTVDNKTVLDLEDDAAHVNWGGLWRMPTSKQMHELCIECTWTLIEEDNVEGYEVKGSNGNSIFLPAAGWIEEDFGHMQDDIFGYYWSTSLYTYNPCEKASNLGFSRWGHDCDRGCYRCTGFSVRAVCELN